MQATEPFLLRHCVVTWSGNGEPTRRFHVSSKRMCDDSDMYYDDSLQDKLPGLFQRARESFEWKLLQLESSRDAEEFMTDYSAFPTLLDDLDAPLRTLYRDDTNGNGIYMHEWRVGVDEAVLGDGSKELFEDLVGVICSGVFHTLAESLEYREQVRAFVRLLATFPLQGLSFATRGIEPPDAKLRHVWTVHKIKLPGHMWSWFAAIYAYLPAMIARRFCTPDGRFVFGPDATFNPAVMTCRGCRGRLTTPPAPVQSKSAEDDKTHYTKRGILGSSLCYLGVTEAYTRACKEGCVTAHCDGGAMRCLAKQVQFAKVLAHRAGLDEAYCMGLWPGCGS